MPYTRTYIESSNITLYTEDGYPRFFEIYEAIDKDSGSSAVVYSAGYNGKGVLKEFFPQGFDSVRRDENGMIIYDEYEKEAFKKRLSLYIRPYHAMKAIREDESIAGFIPHFEIYYGDPDKNGSAYIWTPQPPCVTFEKICEEVHNKPHRSEYDLVRVLCAIESLAECINLLHSKDLIHCDIKPSNFGFLKRGKKVLYDSISLFDINTISYFFDDDRPVPISVGFTDTEIKNSTGRARHDYYSDIFSIGAVLYCALCGSNYNDDNFNINSIENVINNSETICAFPPNSYPGLKNILIKILCKTLCSKNERYESCEELLEDIRTALGLIIPAALSEQTAPGKKWKLTDIEKYLDKISSAINRHLYEYPLYRNITNERESIRLLIIGLDMYSARFLDAALQAAHIPGKSLEITVISDGESESYLKSRPELKNFFNVNGSLGNDPKAYGKIKFIDSPSTELIIQDTDFTPDYIFMSADNCSSAGYISERFPGCTVSYACIRKAPDIKKSNNLIPVYLGSELSGKLPDDLERMGFNTHLVWNDNLNIDFAEKKKEYRLAYNHNSCINFLMSIKYKLYGSEVNTDDPDIHKTVKNYIEHISDESKKNELIYLEHKRWVTEKICSGYRSITDLNDCAYGKPRDEARKRHGCIVRSSPERNLSGGIWRNDNKTVNHKAWNDPPKEEFESLCPLEQMSVNLHRVYKKHADAALKNDLFNDGTAAEIQSCIDTSPEAVSAYRELINCMKDISKDENGSTGQHKRYPALKKRFEDAVKNSGMIDGQTKLNIKQLSDSLAGRFYPVCESRRFHDYKDEDVKLIERLPFILTYSEDICMVLPYISGDNTELFSNLKAPMIVNPGRMIYAVYCKDDDSISKFIDELPRVADYTKKRNRLHGSIEFVIGIKNKTYDTSRSVIRNNIREADGGRIKSVKIIPADDTSVFAEELKKYITGINNIMIEMKGIFENSGIFNDFPLFRYDGHNGTSLENINNCETACQIKARPYITTDDMFSFGKNAVVTSNDPEFPDYKELWQLYRSNTREWKQLCRAVKDHSDKSDVIAFFGISEEKNSGIYSCLIPFSCKKAAQNIINSLKKAELAGENTDITAYTTEMCRVSIEDIYGNMKNYDRLFSNPHTLMNPGYIKVKTDKKENTVKVIFNSLSINDLDTSSSDDAYHTVLDDLSRRGYISGYSHNGDKVSFTFASLGVKELLSAEERLPEIYTYHSAYSTSGFDDIRSKVSITCGRDIYSIDCILTKNFSSIFAECVSAESATEEHFTELARAAGKFGIDPISVMIADGKDIGEEKREYLTKLGNKYNVVTICDPDDIDNIGQTLLGIIK